MAGRTDNLHRIGEGAGSMEVSFRTNVLRRCFERSAEAERRWGTVVGRKYIQRIETLVAGRDFEWLQTVRSLRLHPLEGDRAGLWSMTLHDRWRLIVVPEGETAVTVWEVTNHYGD